MAQVFIARSGEQRTATGLEALCMSRPLSPRLLLAALVPTLLAGATPVLGGTPASAAGALSSITLTQLPNPGAEVDASGWTGINAAVTRTTSPIQSGAGAFAVQASATGHMATITTTYLQGFPANASLRISAWVRSAAVPRGAVLQADWHGSAGYISTSSAPQAVSTTSGWTQLAGSISPAVGADRVRVYVKFLDVTPGEVQFVDDVRVAVEAPAGTTNPPSSLSRIANPGAEVDTSGWVGVNGTLSRTTSPVQKGVGAFRVRTSAAGHTTMLARDSIRGVVAGQPLIASSWVRSALTTRGALLQADWRNAAGYLSTSSTSTVTTSRASWTQLKRTLTPPAGADRVQLYVRFLNAAKGEVHFVDEVQTSTAVASPAPAPTSPAPAPVAPAPSPVTPPPTTAPAPPSSGLNPTPPLPGVTLAWSDEFDGSAIDTSKWSNKEPWQSGPGFANDSEAWLPNPATSTNLTVANGTLSLKARREALATNNGRVMTTAMMTSRDKYNTFTHGVIEARVKLPTGKGLWPAFWLLGNGTGASGWPKTGEVDIFEYVNNASGGNGRMYSSVHWGDVVNGSISSHHAASKSAASPWWGDGQFHTFSLHRTSSFLRFSIDGVQVMELAPGELVPYYATAIPAGGALFDDPMHVRLSLEVGGPWAGQGYSSSQYEGGDMVVDYVRAWK